MILDLQIKEINRKSHLLQLSASSI